MVKFISVMWSEGISEREHTILANTLEQVIRWLNLRHPAAFDDPPLRIRLFGNWIIPPLVPDHPYWGTQWYINQSYDEELEQVIAPVYLELVRKEPWQKVDPHYDIALMEHDLTDFPAPLARLRPEHYALSASFPGASAILSTRRIHLLEDVALCDLALARLTRHCLGHALGAVDFTRKEDVARLGLELHCTNRCVMRHAASVEELVTLGLEEQESGWAFCPTCTRALFSIMVRESYVWN
ncbi:MAG: hypothetical protein ACYCZF_03140 [Anaerolineae bacterium]